jgi:hypothetical protein
LINMRLSTELQPAISSPVKEIENNINGDNTISWRN